MRINTFDQYQEAAALTAIYPKDAGVLYPALGLAGEVGEVAAKVADGPPSLPRGFLGEEELCLRMAAHAGEACNQVKKIIRDDDCDCTPKRTAAIAKEIGGVLWYCAALATDLGLNLGDIARGNIEILVSRQERGTLKGDGDNR
ncbi:MAG: nucleoside triphosphate pyrophosphohydrolase family protein [Planctomycetota bacterium]|jgi:NTP pyrophosphatase (non-canonical NTP hydrolase)